MAAAQSSAEIRASAAAGPKTGLARPRIGLICDFVEEQWPSMDLVANMLFDFLDREHAEFAVTRICPPLNERFGKLPGVGAAPALRNADRLVNRFVDYSRALKPKLDRFDLFHIVDHSYSQLVYDLPAARTVVTCHDLDTFRSVLEPERYPRPRWFRAMTRRVLGGFQKAAHVIAVSAATRDDILRHGLHPAERITVISNGVDLSCTSVPDSKADAEFDALLSNHPLARDGQPSAWLLNVGSSMPRKRLDLLLRVFAEVHRFQPDARLLRIGERFTAEQRELARQLGIESCVFETGSLSREMLAAAYRRADLLVHTADAEGFGLPLVEAMACGCPVIASDIAVLREVGGKAAAYATVGDIAAWRDAVIAALARRRDPASLKIEKAQGFANAARFSWTENARRTAGVYERILRASS